MILTRKQTVQEHFKIITSRLITKHGQLYQTCVTTCRSHTQLFIEPSSIILRKNHKRTEIRLQQKDCLLSTLLSASNTSEGAKLSSSRMIQWPFLIASTKTPTKKDNSILLITSHYVKNKWINFQFFLSEKNYIG